MIEDLSIDVDKIIIHHEENVDRISSNIKLSSF